MMKWNHFIICFLENFIVREVRLYESKTRIDRHFYETFIIDRNKGEEPSGYGYAYAQYIKSL